MYTGVCIIGTKFSFVVLTLARHSISFFLNAGYMNH